MEVLDYDEERQKNASQVESFHNSKFNENDDGKECQKRDGDENGKQRLDNEEEEDSETVLKLTSHIQHPISAKIVGYKRINSTFNVYSIYEIVLSTECPEYGKFVDHTIERRFSHFLDLYARLNIQYPDATIPLPPPKNYSEFSAFDLTESNRLAWLQIFLDLLLLSPVLRVSALVIHFLTQKNAPDLIQKSPVGILKDGVGKISEKLISLKYSDMDSDEWYLDLKSQLTKIESSIKTMSHKLGGTSLTFKPFAVDFMRTHLLIRELSTQIGAGTPDKHINALSDIFKLIGEHCNRESPTKDKINCYNSVYSMFMVHLGSINLIIRSFKAAFEDREKVFRPISDIDEELKEAQIAKSNSHTPQDRLKELEELITKKSAELQMHRKHFDEFSKNQKAILSLFKEYLNQYVKSTLLTFLENIIDVERSKLNSLQGIKASLE